jgi:hypothetical protein
MGAGDGNSGDILIHGASFDGAREAVAGVFAAGFSSRLPWAGWYLFGTFQFLSPSSKIRTKVMTFLPARR